MRAPQVKAAVIDILAEADLASITKARVAEMLGLSVNTLGNYLERQDVSWMFLLDVERRRRLDNAINSEHRPTVAVLSKYIGVDPGPSFYKIYRRIFGEDFKSRYWTCRL